MNSLENAQHPLWATIRFIVLCGAVTLVLWRNANSFDETEVRAILEIALMAGGYEGVMSYLSVKKKKDNTTTEA